MDPGCEPLAALAPRSGMTREGGALDDGRKVARRGGHLLCA
jgi:hypothetical protein